MTLCRSRGRAATGDGSERAGTTTSPLLAIRFVSSRLFALIVEFEGRLKAQAYCRRQERLVPESVNNPG